MYDIRAPGKCLALLLSNVGAVRSLRFSDCGNFLAAAEPADFVTIFDVTTRSVVDEKGGTRMQQDSTRVHQMTAVLGGGVPHKSLYILNTQSLCGEVSAQDKPTPLPSHRAATSGPRSLISLASWRASHSAPAATA